VRGSLLEILRLNYWIGGRHKRAGIVAISFEVFHAPCLLEGLARDLIDGGIDTYQLARFSQVRHGYLRSAILAPILSSTVLLGWRTSP
jgi:hypothetical protein